MFCDSKSVATVLLGEKYLDCSKHETVKIECLRDLICDGVMSVEWNGTEHMVSDALTNAASWNKFDGFMKKVGLCRNDEEKEKILKKILNFCDSLGIESILH
jgi:hypothetical protein